MIYLKSIFISILFFLISGCGVVEKENFTPIQKPLLAKQKENIPAIREFKVDSQSFDLESLHIPNNAQIEKVKIMGASLTDVISLLTEATNESIVFQLESDDVDNNDEDDNDYIQKGSELLTNTNVYLSASHISIGRLLEKAVGSRLSIGYDDGTYYLGDINNLTLKIPSIKGLGTSLESSLKTFGASKVVFDPITSSISFSARSKEYKEITKYLNILKNNLYVIEYAMEIYNVQLNDEYNLGIDWSMIPKAIEDTTFTIQSVSNSLASTVPYKFGVIKKGGSFESLSAILNVLEQFGKVESIQRPKLLGLAGTKVSLKDGTQEAYIKSLQTTVINDGAQTSTVSGTALSGLEITLDSNIIDETVVSNIDIKINDIVGYTSFSANNQEYMQPKISTKEIQNTVRVKPGVPIVISGLYRQKRDVGHKGVPKTSGTMLNNVAGSDYKSQTKSEMVIIVTPRLIKYTVK